MIKISVLNDDRCNINKLVNVHGLSLYIETEEISFLFDVGQADCFIKNARQMNIDLSSVKLVVLSHGHYDHTNGLVNVANGTKIICHPNCTVWRKSNRTGEFNGMPLSRDEFTKKFNVKFAKEPYFISKNVVFLGEIERIYDFECKKFPSTLIDGSVDTAIDDTGIAIKAKEGLIVVTGCGHSGICNTVEWAKKVTGENKIYAVIGGFHLKNIDEQTIKTIEYLKNINVKNIVLGHCTSDEVCEYFKDKLRKNINIDVLETGKILKF